MRSLPNIEKSGFRSSEYVGYAAGVWRICRSVSRKGNWVAFKRDDETEPALYAKTLADMSARLTDHANEHRHA